MTQPTTTEILENICDLIESGDIDEGWEALEALEALDDMLTSGSPLPAQWPQAKELEELRAKVAKHEKALRAIGEHQAAAIENGRGLDHEDVEELWLIAEEALKP